MAYFALKAREGHRVKGTKPRDRRVKVNLELGEGYIKNVRITCVMRRGDTETNIRVGGAVHQTIAEFEKSTHIKEDTALLYGGEIEGAES